MTPNLWIHGSGLLDPSVATSGAGGQGGEPAEPLLSGADAFYLYDTLDFPLDLTKLMAREAGLAVDAAGFDAAMGAQRAQARAEQL